MAWTFAVRAVLDDAGQHPSSGRAPGHRTGDRRRNVPHSGKLRAFEDMRRPGLLTGGHRPGQSAVTSIANENHCTPNTLTTTQQSRQHFENRHRGVLPLIDDGVGVDHTSVLLHPRLIVAAPVLDQ